MFYDDNFGFYDIEDQDDIDFYYRMQDASVEKECEGCGDYVRIKPEYAYCNSCADKREKGWDF